ARRAADAVVAKGRLRHVGNIPAYLDDYAFLVWGLLNLYEATGSVGDLTAALSLTKEALDLFGDDNGMLYLTAHNAEALVTRPHSLGDGAVPSGASVLILDVVRLA